MFVAEGRVRELVEIYFFLCIPRYLIARYLQIPTDCLKEEKDSIIEKLKERAVREPCCGQTAVVERRGVLVPKSEVIVHAIITNIIEYGGSLEASSLSNGLLKRRNEGLIDGGICWKRTKGRKRTSRHRR